MDDNKKHMLWGIFITLGITITVSTSYIGYELMYSNTVNEDYQFISIPDQVPKPKTPDVVATPKIKTYISEKLRVKFQYLDTQGDPVTEIGNKIYLSGEKGQSVEKFSKDTQIDLKSAIENKFLIGISKKDCDVDVQKSGSRYYGYIRIVGLKNNIDDPLTFNNPCPEKYRQTNGIQYFYMDEKDPTSFFFFKIGQYSINAEVGPKDYIKTWQDTFEIINIKSNGTTTPIGFSLNDDCKIVGWSGDADPSVGNGYESKLIENEWLIDCGSKNNSARGVMGPILLQQGWEFCSSKTSTGTWWKGGIITTVVESAGANYPFRISQRNGNNCH